MPIRPLQAACESSSVSLCWGDQSLAVSWKNRVVDVVGLPSAQVVQNLHWPGCVERGFAVPDVQDLVCPLSVQSESLLPQWELLEWVSLP